MEPEILHDKEKKRFYIVIDGVESLLDYSIKNKTLDFYHTFVPDKLRGQGIAKLILTKAAVYARENGFQVIPTCAYAKTFFKRYKEFSELAVKNN